MTPLEAVDLGWSVIPCGANKKPLIKTWREFQTQRPTKEQVGEWDRNKQPATWAFITGAISGRITLDFDGVLGRNTIERLGIQPHRRTPSQGRHADFEHPGWRVSTLTHKTKRALFNRWPGLDIRGDGGYAIFLGQTARGKYSWLRRPPAHSLRILPADLLDFLRAASAPQEEQSPRGAPVSSDQAEQAPRQQRIESDRLVSMALDHANAEGRNNAGFWLACQLRDNGYSQGEARDVMQMYAARVRPVNAKGDREPYTEQEAFATLQQAYSRPGREPWQRKPPVIVQGTPRTTQRGEIPDLLSQHSSDYGNAQRLLALYGDNLRYCHAFQKWLTWDGFRWAVDYGEHARNMAQKTILEFARQALAAKNDSASSFAGSCLNSQRITNALRELQPHLAVTPAQLDTHADLLNFANGTLDLKRGRVRPHQREDFITKLVHYDFRPDAGCPLFLEFLKRITANHPHLIDYLQRAFGYSLSAHTIEKAVFLLHGRGDNGKTTLLSLFLKLLEEYAVLLQIDTLMVRQENNNTQADLADLRGARFVMTSETEDGQRLAESKLKRITQGMGRIKAVRKYENPIEFPETHKLWIDANYLPMVRGTDNAIWNRLHAIPFDVAIPKPEQDKDLPAKLAAEAEGILAWGVVGTTCWYNNGLGKPTEVETAGQAWRAKSDQIGRFIQEMCVRGEYAQVKAHALYIAYKNWADDGGERPVTETAFGERIAEKYERKRESAGNVYLGIGLTAANRSSVGM
jgi:putative DNA primase/helicase